MMKSYVYLDLETTGLNNPVGSDQIIQIAAIRVDETHETRFVTYVQLEDGRELPEFITKLTGITGNELSPDNAMTLPVALNRLKELVRGATVVAQWAPFDLSFIPNEVVDFYCTRTMSYLNSPLDNPSLKPTCERLGIELERAHDAYHDCTATRTLFNHYKELLGSDLEKYKNVVVDTEKRPLLWVPKTARVITSREGGRQDADYVPYDFCIQ